MIPLSYTLLEAFDLHIEWRTGTVRWAKPSLMRDSRDTTITFGPLIVMKGRRLKKR